MRNVRFNDDVVKELRRLVRNSNLGSELKAALVKIYVTGYDNGLADASRKIREVLNEHNEDSGVRGLAESETEMPKSEEPEVD